MNPSSRGIVLLLNAGISALMIAGYALWLAPSHTPRFAVLDVAELYRLKETQVAAQLVKPGASDTERTVLLKNVHGFGADVTRLIDVLKQECGCLIVAHGALVGPDTRLPDLTPELRRRLGL